MALAVATDEIIEITYVKLCYSCESCGPFLCCCTVTTSMTLQWVGYLKIPLKNEILLLTWSLNCCQTPIKCNKIEIAIHDHDILVRTQAMLSVRYVSESKPGASCPGKMRVNVVEIILQYIQYRYSRAAHEDYTLKIYTVFKLWRSLLTVCLFQNLTVIVFTFIWASISYFMRVVYGPLWQMIGCLTVMFLLWSEMYYMLGWTGSKVLWLKFGHFIKVIDGRVFNCSRPFAACASSFFSL